MELTDQVRREIGQHFVVGFPGYDVNADIETLIRDYYVGNVIIMRRNVQSAKQIHSLLHKLQLIAMNAGHERPLMIGTDQENGILSAFTITDSDVAGTQFPGAMALGATGSPDLAERVSEASARELKLVGMNWTYSPVADVNSDSRNPVIGVRSFGDDPKEVSRYVAAVCRGLTKAGVAASAKHFPGHGDTHVDSHLSLPIIHKDATALAQIDLVPFQTASNAQAATIMIGHMALPAITGNNTPASLSRTIVKDMLRGSLDYNGVAVTDCLEMGAVEARKGGVPKAAVQALKAGNDIVMMCHRFDRQRDAVEAVYDALRNGGLDQEPILASGKRIAALKDAFAGNWDQVLGTIFDEAGWGRLKAENAVLSRQAYASSIALVRNPHDVIPLSKPKTSESREIVVVLTPRMGSTSHPVMDDADAPAVAVAPNKRREQRIATAGPTYLSFVAGVNKRVKGASLHDVYSPWDPLGAEVGDAIDRGLASSVLFVTRNASRAAWQLDKLREVLRRVGKKGSRRLDKVVVLASYGPYDLLQVAPGSLDGEEGMGLEEIGYVACFEPTPKALDAAAAVIFGEEEARGKVPVCGGNVFPTIDSWE